MKGVFHPRPTYLPVRILFLVMKGAVNLVVWVAAVSEKYFTEDSSDPLDPHREPRYPRRLLRFPFLNVGEIVIHEDLIEHYQKICHERSRREADQWLFDEVVESLLRLILRRAFLTQLHASIRSFLRSFYSQEKIANAKSKASGLVLLTVDVWSHRRQKLASLTVAVLALTSTFLLYRAPVQVVDNVEVPSDQQSSKQVAMNTQNPSPLPMTQPEPSTFTRYDALDNRRSASKVRPNTKRSIASENVTLAMFDVTRDSQESKSVREVPKKRINFTLLLPSGTKSGLFRVTLQDAGGNNLAYLTAPSRDGKSLHAVLDMQQFGSDEYRILVSQKKGEVATSDYRFRINKK